MLTKLSAALFIFCFVFTACRKQPAYIPVQSSGPNIIFFLADDYGYEVPTFDGGQSYQTPNLDALAANSMRFTQCYSTPLCSPSRIMLLTGKYNFRNYYAWGRLGLDQKTIANMLRDAGFNTCIAGKWQIQGADKVIKNFGFDNYCVWDILGGDEDQGSRYKSPQIYENGNYLPADSTKDKYSEDIFTDYIINFIRNNRSSNKPFFIYYPFCVTHTPFSPTPDDPEFKDWDPNQDGNTKFFPSMVKYMDKKIGEIMSEIQDEGIDNNTVVIFSGDNGTSAKISSLYNGEYFQGGKGLTTTSGTHVPLIVSWPGKITPGISDSLVDFTDFLPSLADIVSIPKPPIYGPLDGFSFYPELTNENTSARSWLYCYYAPHVGDKPVQYVQNRLYKYYNTGKFYDLTQDIFEKHPIPDSELTPDEQAAKQSFINVLSGMH